MWILCHFQAFRWLTLFPPETVVDDLTPGGDDWAADGQPGSGAVGDVLGHRLAHHLPAQATQLVPCTPSNCRRGRTLQGSVADPNPDPYGPHGSGSINHSYSYGSGLFYHQAKIVRKTLIPTVLWLFYFLSSKSNKQNNFFLLVFLASWRSMTKIAGSGSASGSNSQRHWSADPDPHQNVMDPQHCFKG